jgi:hypothetical protein
MPHCVRGYPYFQWKFFEGTLFLNLCFFISQPPCKRTLNEPWLSQPLNLPTVEPPLVVTSARWSPRHNGHFQPDPNKVNSFPLGIKPLHSGRLPIPNCGHCGVMISVHWPLNYGQYCLKLKGKMRQACQFAWMLAVINAKVQKWCHGQREPTRPVIVFVIC